MTFSRSIDGCQCLKEVLNHGNTEFVEALRCEQQLGEKVKNQTGIRSRFQHRGSIIKQRGGRETSKQRPKAAVLSCSDSRVPALDIFQQLPDELFQIQLEGNIASAECLGSISYAIEHVSTLEGIVVLGHTDCGAVTAAVDNYLSPKPVVNSTEGSILALIRTIIPSVEIAASAMTLNDPLVCGTHLRESLNRSKLIDITSFVNAAAMAWKVQEFVSRLQQSVPVWYGVYDLASCRILHVDLNQRDGSLLFGLGDAPNVVDLNDVAKSLVQYLTKMNSFDAAQFTTNGHNHRAETAWKLLSMEDSSSSS